MYFVNWEDWGLRRQPSLYPSPGLQGGERLWRGCAGCWRACLKLIAVSSNAFSHQTSLGGRN